MKTPEELNALKEEPEALNKKHTELSDVELEQAAGGQSVPPEFITRSRGNTFANLPSDFMSLTFDIRNREELINAFHEAMMYIANTQLMEYPNAVYGFTFCVCKDGENQIFPYVYMPYTLSVRRM